MKMIRSCLPQSQPYIKKENPKYNPSFALLAKNCHAADHPENPDDDVGEHNK